MASMVLCAGATCKSAAQPGGPALRLTIQWNSLCPWTIPPAERYMLSVHVAGYHLYEARGTPAIRISKFGPLPLHMFLSRKHHIGSCYRAARCCALITSHHPLKRGAVEAGLERSP
jgi:hypothetical protein